MPDGDGVSEEDAALYMAQDAVLSIFYHEMGHALIDILQAPVLGLEEDAADVLSALLINELWDEAASEQKLRATAAFWAASASETMASGEMPLNYGVHSPDDRRYFTYVCLWYGASPDTRKADPGDDAFAAMLKDEVDYLNSVLSLPQELTVTLAPCGEANAFYDPSVVGVTVCTEITEWALDVAHNQ